MYRRICSSCITQIDTEEKAIANIFSATEYPQLRIHQALWPHLIESETKPSRTIVFQLFNNKVFQLFNNKVFQL